MIPNVRIVSRKAHQVVHQAKDDQQTADRRQDKHNLALLDAILTECLHLALFTDVHVLLFDARWEHEVKLRQIDAVPVRLHIRILAHVPEHGKHKRDDAQEA